MAEPFLRADGTTELNSAMSSIVWGKRQNFVVTILPWLIALPTLTGICFSFYWDPFAVYVVIVLTSVAAVFITVLDFMAGRKMLFYCGVLGAFGIFLGCCVGAILYQGWLKQYYHLTYSRFYENVLPSEFAAAHSDAGRLDFAAGAVADASKSVGYMSGGHIYCVAPILNADALRAEFWAIGVDCCGPRSSFNCDGVAASDASELKTGLVMLNDGGVFGGFMLSPFDFYQRAIVQAKASFALVGTDKPLLLRWVKRDSVDSATNWYLFEPVIFYILSLIAYLIMTAFCALVINRSIKRAELLQAPDQKVQMNRRGEDYGAASDDAF